MTENDLNLTVSKNRARIRWIAKTGSTRRHRLMC